MSDLDLSSLEAYFASGPYVQAAILCDRILEESDGALTPVRIVEHFAVSGTVDIDHLPEPGKPIDFESAGVAWPLTTKLLILVRALPLDRESTIAIRVISPSGKRSPDQIFPTQPAGALRGANLNIDLRFISSEVGAHRIEIDINGRVAAQAPLLVDSQLDWAIASDPPSSVSERETGDASRLS